MQFENDSVTKQPLASTLNGPPENLDLYYRTIVENMTEAVFAVHESGEFLYFNNAAAARLGGTPGDYTGKTMRDLFPPRIAESQMKNISGVIATGQRTVSIAESILNGKSGWFRTSISPIRAGEGKPDSVVCVTIDVTEQKRLEKDLEKAIERANAMTVKAELASIAKSQFLATMSHEIRTPLNGVIGMIDLLMETKLADEQKKIVDVIRVSGDALLTLIEDLLDFSRIEAGRLRIDKKEFSIHNVVTEVREILEARARAKGLDFACIVHPDVPQSLVGDPARLRQVLLNLANNAIKFTEQGSVTLDVCRIGTFGSDVLDNTAHLTCSVTDTGIGIAEDQISLLFKQFIQLDNSHVRKYGGTGLGLAISKRIMELMGGTIEVTSAVGEGSIFTASVTLPVGTALLPSSLRRFEAGPYAPVSGQSQPVAVLVAEDNEINQIVIRKTLESLGFAVEMTDNGEQAVAALHRKRYACVFLDLQMPVMDGISAAQRIRDTTSPVLDHGVPIIAMTASSSREDQALCMDAGIDFFLVKPVRRESLLETIGLAIKKSERTVVVGTRPTVLDTQGLLETLDNDETLAADILAHFCQDMPKLMANMEAALAVNDVASAKRFAHTIKGACLNIGAEEMATAAAMADHLNGSADAAAFQTVLSRLRTVFSPLATKISGRQARAS